MKRKVNISLEADQSEVFTVHKTQLGGKLTGDCSR